MQRVPPMIGLVSTTLGMPAQLDGLGGLDALFAQIRGAVRRDCIAAKMRTGVLIEVARIVVSRLSEFPEGIAVLLQHPLARISY